MSSPIISIAEVNLSYFTTSEVVIALDQLTLQLDAGTLVAVVGASGSGKTSLLNVLSGLQDADSGSIEVAGYEVHVMNEAQRAGMRLVDVGVVFQDHNLIPEFSAEENVMLPLRARGLSIAQAKAQTAEWLTMVGIGELGKRMPAQLSGGQRQRVGIARALVGGRKVLLADEPTGSLDAENSSAIFGLLYSLARGGVTVVVATHDQLVNKSADRILTMLDGRIVSDDRAGVLA